MASQKIIVANWKMHTLSLAPWKSFRAPRNVRVVICPPFPYLKEVRQFVSRRIAVGAQDVFWEEKGPYTGEVSPAMIKNLGAEYVIIGHSERRRWLRETDGMINKKVEAAQKAGLKVILCVGEPKHVRRKGIAAAKSFVKKQFLTDLHGFPKNRPVIVAYEPIWAIGTGVADNPEETIAMVNFIRSTLSAKPYNLNPTVIYGGSVNGKNVKSFLQCKEIDGALVGGASLKVKEFEKIIEAAAGKSEFRPKRRRRKSGSAQYAPNRRES